MESMSTSDTSSLAQTNKGPVWIYPKFDQSWADEIVSEFSINPITAQVLASKNLNDTDEIHDYLYGKLPNLLDPHLFPQMDLAVNRIFQALQKHETILICIILLVNINRG